MEWPKYKHTKAVQRVHGRIESILLNFKSAGWLKAVSPVSMRTLMRSVLEQTQLLEDCPHAVLVERNREHNTILRAMQGFPVKMKECSGNPSRDVLLELYDDMKMLRSLTCKGSSLWYAHLEKLFIHASFITECKQQGIAKGLRYLDLGNRKGHSANAYAQLLEAEPETKPGNFMDWVEESLVEALALDVLRTMDMTIAKKKDEFIRADAFFNDYATFVGDNRIFSAAVRERAHAIRALSNSFLGSAKVLGADVDKAVKLITGTKKNDLAKAFGLYKAGIEYIEHATLLVRRKAEDIIADQCLAQIASWSEFGDDDSARFHVGVCQEKATAVASILVKVVELLSSISDIHFEEEADAITKAVMGWSVFPSLCRLL